MTTTSFSESVFIDTILVIDISVRTSISRQITMCGKYITLSMIDHHEFFGIFYKKNQALSEREISRQITMLNVLPFNLLFLEKSRHFSKIMNFLVKSQFTNCTIHKWKLRRTAFVYVRNKRWHDLRQIQIGFTLTQQLILLF